MSTILYRLTIFSFSISFFVSSVQFVQRPGKKIKFVRAWLLLFPKKKKKGKTNPNVSFSFLLSFHPVENSSVEETGRRAVRGTERNKKKKNGKKEKRKRERKKAIDWKWHEICDPVRVKSIGPPSSLLSVRETHSRPGFL